MSAPKQPPKLPKLTPPVASSPPVPAGTSPAALSGVFRDEEERRLFEREFSDVQPWRRGSDRVVPTFEPGSDGPSTDAKVGRSMADARLVVEREGAHVTGAAFGVSHATVRGLGRGDLRVEKTCDLHALHAQPARHRLEQFIDESVALGRRAVLVICGRGRHSGPEGPVLRELVIEALGKPPLLSHILAFSTAPRAHGGEGALVVLLRRRSAQG